MVVFSCDSCGDSLRKKDVQKHYQFACRRCESLTCVDCKKQFWGEEYAAHTQCITDEDFKYGLVKEHKNDKGQAKQDLWISNIETLLADRSTDKRWTPILIEMQQYENVPRKKKPFMNWCKCTMKRFPFKVVEEVFDKLLALNSQKQQENKHQNGAQNTKQNDKMETDQKDDQLQTKGKKKRKNDDDNDNDADGGDDDKPKSKKKIKKSEENGDDAEEESSKKSDKFRLKKCVAQILVEKREPMKIKRILKKVTAAYFEHLEDVKPAGKHWSETDLSAKLEKLVSSNKAFKNCNGVVQLSETGKLKYTSAGGNDDSD